MAFPLVDGTTGETTDVHAGLVAKRVRCAATTAVTKATGVENGDTIDGVTLVTGDRVALLAQASGSENGIWVVAASGAPTRALDFDENAEVLPGTLIVVSEGTANKDSIWQLTTNASITVDTTALVFYPVHLQGTGSPEGAVTAPVGATYRRTDGGAGTSFYVKESGTGNTGWVAPTTSAATPDRAVLSGFTHDTAITTATQFGRFGSSGGSPTFGAIPMVMDRAGSIVGVTVESNSARNAGTLDVEVYKNGVGTGLVATLDGTNTQYHYAVQAAGTDTFAAGDRLDVRGTDSSFGPAGAVFFAAITVLFN